MRLPIAITVTVAFLVVGCSPTSKESLAFQSPADWKVEHNTSGGFELYMLTGKTGEDGLLMFSEQSLSTRLEDIPELVQKLADEFRKNEKNSLEITLAGGDYNVEQFAGEHCQGSYAEFQITRGGTNAVQVMFMMSVDGRVWGGLFCGPLNDWQQALLVLKSIRKKG